MKLIFTTLLLFVMFSISAQVTYAKPEEFSSIKKRELVVELLEVNKSYITKLNKKIQKTKKEEKKKKLRDKIEDYKEFINKYNTFINLYFRKYWYADTKILFKKTSEVNGLFKNKNKKFTIFWYSESSSKGNLRNGAAYFPNLTIPTFNYSRAEKGSIKVDYSFFLPYFGDYMRGDISEGTLILSLIMMKNHIDNIQKTNNKKYTFKKYAKDQATINCNQIKGKELVVPELLIHKKSSISGMSSNFKIGKLKKYTNEEIDEAIINKKDVIIGVSFPFMIAKSSTGGSVSISVARILFFKSFINIKTGEIYTCKGTKMGEFNDTYFRNKGFSKLGKCK